MNQFDGINEAEFFSRNPWFQPGRYVVEVELCVTKDTRKKGLCWFVEVGVLEAQGEGANQPGTSATWTQKMTDRTVALPAIKGFLCAALDIDPEKTIDFTKLATLVTQPANPLMGQRVRLETRIKPTRAGTPFTVHEWQPCPYDGNKTVAAIMGGGETISPDGKWKLVNNAWVAR